MAYLSVYGADFSVTKQKAIEDAKKMRVIVEEECAKAGQEVPPYSLTELTGKGSFGRVYKASDLKTNQVVAVKIIDIEESDTLNPKLADTYSEFLKEINALKLLRENGARNINHVLDALPVGQSMWMVSEYCAGGSVATLMKPTAPGGLQEKWIIPILREVAEAIFWVHKAGIIHRDIKCANVLITEAGGVQLCDFGVSGVIETRFDKRSTFIGTPHWMAPELFDPEASYGIEVDIWAFGSMVFEIASGLPPNVMAGVDVTQLGSYLKQHTPRLAGNKYSEKLKDLVSFCLVEDPAKRPIIEEVQHHPYLFNTENSHPTSSLAMLVKAFRVWEGQGGSRKSLFAMGGAQGPSDADFSSTALANDEWNFSTTVDFDLRTMSNTDAQAVYDVYGSQVDLAEPMPPAFKPKRRRPPPNLPVMRAPLEKVFDPNTISNYQENARAYYGMPELPPASDLPLRDHSNNATLRESLIDLDASLHGGRLSKFVDMETIKAGPRRSRDYEFGDDYARGPNSDPENLLASSNRKTQEWKFPTMMPQSANPEMSHFPFNDDNSGFRFPGSGNRLSQDDNSSFRFPGSGGRPPLQHHTTEPVGFSPDANSNVNLMLPRAASQQDNRISMSSLIDLDESVPEPTMPAELARPSTANSDAASEVGSAFDLERHASFMPLPASNREPSIYVSNGPDYPPPTNIREPSIYVSDDSDFASSLATQRPPMPPLEERTGSLSRSDAYIDDAHLYVGPKEYGRAPAYSYERNGSANGMSDSEYNMGGAGHRSPSISSMNSLYQATDGRPMPPLPGPPSERVMMGEGGHVMRDEFLRLLEGMTSHLKFTGEYVAELPVRKSGRLSGLQNGQEEEYA
ncbi:hypothetical protein N0V82_004594 [Gnomoniopsis sp. IMI 355080]|nr:hypothetical protein N0V82_004594 [Gnomoniopsis sp. IMI 355080]